MRPDLLIPIECLPGPVPEGAPLIATQDAMLFLPAAGDWRIKAGWRGTVLGGDHIGWCDEDGKATLLWDIAEDCGVRLDLSRPPTDAAGYPTRIDGADVAASMLARALGLDPAGGVRWRMAGGAFVLTAGGEHIECWPHVPVFAPAIWARFVHVPALADIDPQDPDAARLAMVAIFAAKPWENR